MITIPMKEFSSFRQEITLEGVPYIFIFNWISRSGFWTIDVLDREENVLIAGVKLVVNYEILSRYPDRGLPPGQLYVVNNIRGVSRIKRYDFYNEVVSLVYLTEEESATI